MSVFVLCCIDTQTYYELQLMSVYLVVIKGAIFMVYIIVLYINVSLHEINLISPMIILDHVCIFLYMSTLTSLIYCYY